MDEQNKGFGESLIREILFAVKTNIILILVTIFICAGCGVAFSYVRKPNYTASVKVSYRASNEQGTSSTADNINMMNAFINTVVDFCDEGVVIDRANSYYVSYTNKTKSDPTLTIDEFIESLNVNDSYSGEQAKGDVEEKYILRSNLSVSVDIEGNEQNVYCFALSYKDKDADQAKIKVKLCVEAYSREIQAPSSAGQEKYFSGIKIDINSLGLVGEPIPDLTKTKLAFLGGVVGVLLATMLVYLISVTDGSVKSKAELEELTGIKHISNINYSVANDDSKIENERSEINLDQENIGGN